MDTLVFGLAPETLSDPVGGVASSGAAAHQALLAAMNRAVAVGQRAALIFINLDRFTVINDTLGMTAGDAVLAAMLQRLRAALAPDDHLAWFGEDKFAVLHNGEDEEQLASKLIDLISRPLVFFGHAVALSASIGIATCPGSAVSPETLMRQADFAMHDARRAGRGCWRRFHPSLAHAATERLALEEDLRAALHHNEFRLFFQPQVRAHDRRLCGFEALLRWRHPVRGNVPPSVIIPIAEELGLIVPIGEWVLRRACAAALHWPGLRVAVNVSFRQFVDGTRLLQAVQDALAISGLPPSRLELEVTESGLFHNGEEVRSVLASLQRLGVQISMDDFGTGYASLSHLLSFPFDKIKIDKCFVADIEHSRASAAVVRSVVLLARGLGIRSTAEGVETENQARLLAEAGSGELQGYLFGRAMPVEEADKMVLDCNKKNGTVPLRA